MFPEYGTRSIETNKIRENVLWLQITVNWNRNWNWSRNRNRNSCELCDMLNIIYHLSFIKFDWVFHWIVVGCFVEIHTSESTWVVLIVARFSIFLFNFISLFIGFVSLHFMDESNMQWIEWNFEQMKIELLTNNINQLQLNSKHRMHLWMNDETNEPKWSSIGDA